MELDVPSQSSPLNVLVLAPDHGDPGLIAKQLQSCDHSLTAGAKLTGWFLAVSCYNK